MKIWVSLRKTCSLLLLVLLRTVQNEALGFPAKDFFTAVTSSVKNCPEGKFITLTRNCHIEKRAPHEKAPTV